MIRERERERERGGEREREIDRDRDTERAFIHLCIHLFCYLATFTNMALTYACL